MHSCSLSRHCPHERTLHPLAIQNVSSKYSDQNAQIVYLRRAHMSEDTFSEVVVHFSDIYLPVVFNSYLFCFCFLFTCQQFFISTFHPCWLATVAFAGLPHYKYLHPSISCLD